MKPYYEDYITHAMRYYMSHTTPGDHKSPADAANWEACNAAIKEFQTYQVDILAEVYTRKGLLRDAVKETAEERRLNEDFVWKIIHQFSRSAALHRNLL
jgi:hypothetical protein